MQGVVLAMSVVYEDVVDGPCASVWLSIAEFYLLNSESLLYESVFVVYSKGERFAVLYVDGVLGASCFVVYAGVCAVVEDDAVL